MKAIKITEHHRRTSSTGGTNAPHNISLVTSDEHEAWHVLVGNMNALQITEMLLNHPKKPKNMKFECRFFDGIRVTISGKKCCNNQEKMEKAWTILFKNASFKNAIALINSRYLDPSYRICFI